MKNGCSFCEKLSNDELCDFCQLEMLETTVYAAEQDYRNKVDEILLKFSERMKVKNEFSNSTTNTGTE